MERYCKALATLHVLILFSVSEISQSCSPPLKQYGTNCSDASIQNFRTGYNITCGCTFGFSLVGPTRRQCTENGMWTGTDSLCRIDIVSITLACFTGLAAILIFTALSCCLISRNRGRKSKERRRLTIKRRNEEAANAGLHGPANHHYTSSSSTKARHDSGLQTDMDMVEIDLNGFNLEMDRSPTDNNPPGGYNLDFIEE